MAAYIKFGKKTPRGSSASSEVAPFPSSPPPRASPPRQQAPLRSRGCLLFDSRSLPAGTPRSWLACSRSPKYLFVLHIHENSHHRARPLRNAPHEKVTAAPAVHPDTWIYYIFINLCVSVNYSILRGSILFPHVIYCLLRSNSVWLCWEHNRVIARNLIFVFMPLLFNRSDYQSINKVLFFKTSRLLRLFWTII